VFVPSNITFSPSRPSILDINPCCDVDPLFPLDF
jgi:hypothetical protein